MTIRIFRPLAAAALALVGIAAPAHASLVTYTNFLVVNNVNVTIACNTIPDCTGGYYGSGRLDFYDHGALTAQTWCIDVSHDLLGPWSNNSGPNTYSFVVTNAVNNGGISNIRNDGGSGHGSFISWNMLGEIGALMKYGMNNIGTYDVSSAVQLAIWDLEYGSAITTSSDSASVQSLAASLLLQAESGQLGYDWNVAWLHYCDDTGRTCNQGQLTLLVPEPSTLIIFGSALVLLAGFFTVRRRRGKPDTDSDPRFFASGYPSL